MKKNFLLLYIGIFALVVLLGLVFFLSPTAQTVPVSFSLSTQLGNENLPCWVDTDGNLVCFLPGYIDLSQVSMITHTEKGVKLNDEKVSIEMLCNNIKLNTPYKISYRELWFKKERYLTFMQSSGVATMYLDTQSRGIEYIHQQKGNKESGAIRIYNIDGSSDYVGEVASISGRGNASWNGYSKKPYNIQLANEADLLGMGKAQEWVLLANAADISNLKNKIIYDFAKQINMPYSPDSQWVDLYLNGEYAGLYLLCERNEAHPERVNLKEDGFLVSVETEQKLSHEKRPYFTTDASQALRIRYPENVEQGDINKMQTQWQSIENAILAENNIDQDSGRLLWEMIDTDSWVKKYLIEEVFSNLDGCFISQFFFKENSNGKVYAGPVWDYDHTLGDDMILALDHPNSLLCNRFFVATIEDYTYCSPWFHNLYKKDYFYNEMVRIYSSEFLPLLNELVTNKINEYSEIIENASKMNLCRWSSPQIDVQATTDKISSYLSERLDFLNRIWIDNEKFIKVSVNPGIQDFAYYYIPYGSNLTQLKDMGNTQDMRFVAWYYTDTNTPFDKTKPIYEDTQIYAVWENSNMNIVEIIQYTMIVLFVVLLFVFFIVELKRNFNKGG